MSHILDSRSISFAVVKFGRHAHERPAGLRVQDDGSMRLKDLLRHWGDDQGLDGDDILDALAQNQRHPPRFVIRKSSRGDTVIQVMPARSTERRAFATPVRSSLRRDEKACEIDDRANGSSARGRGSMSLGEMSDHNRDVSCSPTSVARSRSPSRWRDAQQAVKNEPAVRESPDRMHDAKHAVKKEEADVSELPLRGHDAKQLVKKEIDFCEYWRRHTDVEDDQQLRRWVGFVLQDGFQQYDIRFRGGWMNIQDMAAAAKGALGGVKRIGLLSILMTAERNGFCELNNAGDWVRRLDNSKVVTFSQVVSSLDSQ